ncbi:MAG TPA: hypothetical protein VGD01_11620 [Candidatus Elarobacter sp.]|jgi:hypothetical protein
MLKFFAPARPSARRFGLLALYAAALMLSSTAAAHARDRYLDVRKNFADERIVGAAVVHIAGMDPLTTPWSAAVKGTAIAPPDISFITSIAAQRTLAANGLSAKVPNPLAPGTCKLDAANLPACIDNFGGLVGKVDEAVSTAADNEQGVQRRSSRLLQQNADVSNETASKKLRELISACIFGPAVATVPCGVAPSGTEVDRPTALTSVDVADTRYRNAFSEYIAITGSQAFNDAKDSVKARVTALKAALDTEKTLLDAVDKYRHDVLQPLTPSQYFYDNDVRCGALFNGGREKQITLTFSSTDTRDVTVVCPTPVFVTLGLATDGLPNRTFTTVAPNTAGQPAPPAGATPAPSIIAENDRGKRVIAQTMLHVGLGAPDENGSGLAYSLGIGAPVFSGGGGSVDLLTGLSYSHRRTAVITAGIAFGKTLDLAPGYAAGGPILPGTTPPTLNRFASAFFFGVSFGR